jgi:hypothetical protein
MLNPNGLSEEVLNDKDTVTIEEFPETGSWY